MCRMTIRQLAEMLMVHETTCTRLVSEFERKELIQRYRGGIHIRDARDIERYAEEKTL